ncbi:MAG: GtrA family protein [Leptospirales bacterium]|nr:GtrA family protein [Leptospirales bacterium]
MITLIELMRVVRFGFSGGISTAIHAACVIVLVDFLGMDPVAASVPAFLIANVNSYLMNRFWVFKARSGSAGQFAVFFIVSVVGLLINLVGMYVGTRVLEVPYKITLAICVLLAAAVTYLLHKLLTFRERINHSTEVS